MLHDDVQKFTTCLEFFLPFILSSPPNPDCSLPEDLSKRITNYLAGI